jgi:hypothetical protein
MQLEFDVCMSNIHRTGFLASDMLINNKQCVIYQMFKNL